MNTFLTVLGILILAAAWSYSLKLMYNVGYKVGFQTGIDSTVVAVNKALDRMLSTKLPPETLN